MEQLDNLRLEIDGIAQLVYDLEPFPRQESARFTTATGNTLTREVEMVKLIPFSIAGHDIQTLELYEAHKSLLLAKAWIGKLMGELGGISPYKNDGNRKSEADIEPTDAHANHLLGWGENDNHVTKVDKLRQMIQKIIDKCNMSMKTWGNISGNQIFIHLTEARLHLGFELGRIREEITKENV